MQNDVCSRGCNFSRALENLLWQLYGILRKRALILLDVIRVGVLIEYRGFNIPFKLLRLILLLACEQAHDWVIGRKNTRASRASRERSGEEKVTLGSLCSPNVFRARRLASLTELFSPSPGTRSQAILL